MKTKTLTLRQLANRLAEARYEPHGIAVLLAQPERQLRIDWLPNGKHPDEPIVASWNCHQLPLNHLRPDVQELGQRLRDYVSFGKVEVVS